MAIEKTESTAPTSPAALPLAPTSAKAPKSGEPTVDPVLLAYYMIYESVLTANQTAQREAKQLQNNALAQNRLIDQEQKLDFVVCGSDASLKKFLEEHPGEFPSDIASVVTKKVNGKDVVVAIHTKQFSKSVEMDVMNKVQETNTEVSALRTYFSGKLNSSRQDAQLQEADLNTSANNSSNSMSQGSALMQLLASLTNQITQI